MDILTIGYAVADAAAAAIHFGKFGLALEWLEQGRSIVWGQMLQLRTPLDVLRQHHPDEADELELVSRALDSASITSSLDHSSSSSDSTSQSLEMVAQAHRRRAKEYDHILARIRNFPGFSDFLRPKKSISLCSAAICGPVIVVNASSIRCDALILLPHSSQVSHVPLPALHISAVQGMQLQLAGSTRGANMIERHYAPHGGYGVIRYPREALVVYCRTHPIPSQGRLLSPFGLRCTILIYIKVATRAGGWRDAAHNMVLNRAPRKSNSI